MKRLRYYVILLSISIFITYLMLGITAPTLGNWACFVVARFIFYACADVLGEGLMVMIRKLEEDAKEFYDEVDNINIVGTYLISRGLSRALASTLGGYFGLNMDTRATYFVACIIPLAMAFFARETFFERELGEVERTTMVTTDGFNNGLYEFRDLLNIKVIAVHLSLLLLASSLPVGDLAHKKVFLDQFNRSEPEIILLIYVYQSLLTFGVLYYIVAHHSKMNKKYLVCIGLGCILAATLPPLILTNKGSPAETSRAGLLFLSTLFHLFSHLGANILSLVYFSLLISFVDRPFSQPAISSGLSKLLQLCQPITERRLTGMLGHAGLAVSCWALISGVLALYLTTEENPDQAAEEALMLTSYRQASKEKRNMEEERGLILDFSGGDGPSLEASSEEMVKHF